MEEEQPKVGPKGEGVGTTESKVTESAEDDWSVVQSDEHRVCYQKIAQGIPAPCLKICFRAKSSRAQEGLQVGGSDFSSLLDRCRREFQQANSELDVGFFKCTCHRHRTPRFDPHGIVGRNQDAIFGGQSEAEKIHPLLGTACLDQGLADMKKHFRVPVGGRFGRKQGENVRRLLERRETCGHSNAGAMRHSPGRRR